MKCVCLPNKNKFKVNDEVYIGVNGLYFDDCKVVVSDNKLGVVEIKVSKEVESYVKECQKEKLKLVFTAKKII